MHTTQHGRHLNVNLPTSVSFSHLSAAQSPANNSNQKGCRKNSHQFDGNLYGCVPANFNSSLGDLGCESNSLLVLPDGSQQLRRKHSIVSGHRVSFPDCADGNSNFLPNNEHSASHDNELSHHAVDPNSDAAQWGYGPEINAVQPNSKQLKKNSASQLSSVNQFTNPLNQFAKRLSSTGYIRSLKALPPYRPLKPLSPPKPFRPIPFGQPFGPQPFRPLGQPRFGANPYNFLSQLSRRSVHFFAGPYNHCVSFSFST
ncbi:hypothetical protein Ddc_01264 [Ditylenchus destructor]|nr:hypothetical protein Ddc_01264 [Ditylenchus destructor]